MRRGGGQRPQGREPLLARQHGLGNVQRQGHARGLLGRLADIGCDQDDAGHVGDPRGGPVLKRQRRRGCVRGVRNGREHQREREEAAGGADDQHRPQR